MHEHILSTFDHSLNRLREQVLTMASIARRNLGSSMRGLLERNTDLCNSAIAADQDVNELEKNIDQLGMQILLKFQPTAHDLRQVMGTIRVANNLERISDQACSIAKRARAINLLPEIAEVSLLQPVYHLCARNLEASIQAFTNADPEAAAATRLLDKELDAAEKSVDQALLRVMEARQAPLEGYLHLIFVARFLERVGDHAKNICEDTIFIEKAEDIRFDKNKREALS
ncbi:phosphate transport system protein [Prosthecobacter debontii]|uniref:Phosphate-specific transport system accessory protein PhoU n=1 Tax=Prosthecobacter debontii TaxID=48467 RepID=A0A1T4YQX0_9BACT|nr:phosphate transport system protein [Prosthecobacter debontii]